MMRTVDDGPTEAYASHLTTCGAWYCPRCGPGIASKRRRLLEATVSKWVEDGGGVSHAVLTIEHGTEPLREVVEDFGAAWAGLSSRKARRSTGEIVVPRSVSRSWREWRERWGVLYIVSVLEVTARRARGGTSWHPHRHALMLTASPLTEEQGRQARAELVEVWRAAVAATSERKVHAFGVWFEPARTPAATARYAAKVADGLAAELSHTAAKRYHDSRSPAMLLEEAAAGDKWAARAVEEIERCTRLRICVGLGRAAAAILGPERRDELAAGPNRPAETVAQISTATWLAIVRARAEAAAFAAAALGASEFFAWLAGFLDDQAAAKRPEHPPPQSEPARPLEASALVALASA